VATNSGSISVFFIKERALCEHKWGFDKDILEQPRMHICVACESHKWNFCCVGDGFTTQATFTQYVLGLPNELRKQFTSSFNGHVSQCGHGVAHLYPP
jgi:hypothetical protein